MNVQENESALSILSTPGDHPAGPVSGGINTVNKRSLDISADNSYRSHANLPGQKSTNQFLIRPKGRQTPTKGGVSSQINLARSAEEKPSTVSYNTKVFNREIVALRNEEEALIKY